jgi:hypothetical protein
MSADAVNEQLISWLHTLDELGIASVRLHLLEVDDEALRVVPVTAWNSR